MDSSALLAVWEQGANVPVITRSLGLLALAWPDRSVDDWARAGVGERDEHLLRLREALFGDRFEALADCPQCGERVELTFSASDVRVPVAATEIRTDAIDVSADGFLVQCRVPNSLDLLESSQCPAHEQRMRLMRRCVVSVRRDGADVAPENLPETVVGVMAERLAQADPQSSVDLSLTCPACRHQWLMTFDIVSWLWGEIEDWAQRLFLDIHALASAYGWSEHDILAMTPRRRRHYLDLLGA